MSVKSIREIKEELKQIPPERLPEYLALYRDDGRKGVQDVLKDAGESPEKIRGGTGTDSDTHIF